MRGKGCFTRCNISLIRITPAYAGKSQILRAAETVLWDHPRVCGEKGKLIPFYVDEVDHPRVCGEKRE